MFQCAATIEASVDSPEKPPYYNVGFCASYSTLVTKRDSTCRKCVDFIGSGHNNIAKTVKYCLIKAQFSMKNPLVEVGQMTFYKCSTELRIPLFGGCATLTEVLSQAKWVF